jgi:hypothetical protein
MRRPDLLMEPLCRMVPETVLQDPELQLLVQALEDRVIEQPHLHSIAVVVLYVRTKP